MGSSKNAARKSVVIRAGMPLAHAFPKGAKRRKRRLKPVEHVFGQQAELLGVFLDSVVDRRLDVGDDEPVEIIKQPALNDLCCKRGALRVSHVAGVFVPEHAGQEHFVGLLVNFKQFHWPQLVIPA